MEARSEDAGNQAEPERVRVIECRDCGAEHYWCDACQRAMCPHAEARFYVRYQRLSLFRRRPTAPPLSLEPLRAFVARVLGEVDEEAKLVEFAETAEARYAIRLETPREVGKSFSLHKGLVENAVIHPRALRSLRSILHAEVLFMKTIRAVSDYHGRVWPDA